jgi:hypothetical protein
VPKWKVELVAEVQADFSILDGSVKKQVLKQLVKLEQNPQYSEHLGNKAGITVLFFLLILIHLSINNEKFLLHRVCPNKVKIKNLNFSPGKCIKEDGNRR